MEESISFQRLLELAQRADRIGRCGFTPFLTPPEAELAQAAARRCGVEAELFGGYEDAERRMARFLPAMTEEEPFPMTALEITWPHQDAPAHRDLLGAVMGLGVKRQCVGDIVLLPGKAYLFAESAMAAHLQSSLLEAGRVRLAARLTDELPALEPPKGVEIRGTVQSVRLDAVLAEGFAMSRSKAAELIAAGAVKLRHQPTLRPDARPEAGDAISVRGHGRLTLEQIGAPTRKGRLPVVITRFGNP